MDLFIYLLLLFVIVGFVLGLAEGEFAASAFLGVVGVVLVSILISANHFMTPTLITSFSEEKDILGMEEQTFGDVRVVGTKYQLRCLVRVTQDYPGMFVLGTTLKQSVKGKCYENPEVGEAEKSLRTRLTTKKENTQ